MKHLKNFNTVNESSEGDIIITKAEIDAINPDILKGYSSFSDDAGTEFILNHAYYSRKGSEPVKFGDDMVNVYDVFTAPTSDRYKYGSHMGFALVADGQPKHFVFFYEPHGYDIIEGKDLFVAYGHENVVLLFPDGEIKTIYTR